MTAAAEVVQGPPWLEVARRELGVHETPGPVCTSRIADYHSLTRLHAMSDEIAWCSAFVCWCMEHAGIESTHSAAARSWLSWGVPLAGPCVGAVVVFGRRDEAHGHVGFVSAVRGAMIEVLGGNQANCVCVRARAAADALGYRWPVGCPVPSDGRAP